MTQCRYCNDPAEHDDGLCADCHERNTPNETPSIPPDPDEQNDDRAEWARVAVETFATTTGLDTRPGADGLDTAIADLLADLGHLCDREGLSLPALFQRAASHYNEETEQQGSQLDTIPS